MVQLAMSLALSLALSLISGTRIFACLPPSLAGEEKETLLLRRGGGEGKSEVRSRKSNVSSSRQNGFVRIEYLIHIVQRERGARKEEKEKREINGERAQSVFDSGLFLPGGFHH